MDRDPLRFEVRVKPRAALERVGGTWGDGALVVAVSAPAVAGRANRAVVEAISAALGVRPRQVAVVGGHHHRSKVIEVSDPPAGASDRLDELRSAGAP